MNRMWMALGTGLLAGLFITGTAMARPGSSVGQGQRMAGSESRQMGSERIHERNRLRDPALHENGTGLRDRDTVRDRDQDRQQDQSGDRDRLRDPSLHEDGTTLQDRDRDQLQDRERLREGSGDGLQHRFGQLPADSGQPGQGQYRRAEPAIPAQPGEPGSPAERAEPATPAGE